MSTSPQHVNIRVVEVPVFGYNHRHQHTLDPCTVCTAGPKPEAALAGSREAADLASDLILSH